MGLALEDLPILLDLEKIEGGLFRGQSEDLGLCQIFGGRVVGQALYAAKETVPEERLVHSLYSYFLHPGDSQKPIVYDVEALCDGNSPSTRRVAVVQNGKSIFYTTVPFQMPGDGFEHRKTMPNTPGPDKLKSETEIARSVACLLPPSLKEKLINDRPLETRPVEFRDPLKGYVVPPARQVWVRANGELQDNLRAHQYLLGYASDLNSLSVALQPHGIGFLEKGIQITTIDHSMWFHRPFNINEWLLYNVESTSASDTRGFVHGEFYTQDDVLAASTAQEGVMRNRN